MMRVVSVADLVPAEWAMKATPEVMQGVILDVMTAARAFWIKIAQEELHKSRFDYIHGIQQVVAEGDVGASISLVGLVPNMVEEGQDPYDMHTTLLGPQVPVVPVGSGLRGKHALKSGKGYWRIIPFRHQTPGTQGKGGGTPMGDAYDGHDAVADAKALGKQIYSFAKKLEGSKGMPGGKVAWGGRLPAGLAPKLKAKHSTDIFAGMVKVEKQYEKSTQSTYMTFRVISDAVPDKWHSPGVEAHNLGASVQTFIEGAAENAFGALFDDDGGA